MVVLIKPAKSSHKYCDFSQIDNKVKSTYYLWQTALGIFASFWLFLLRREVSFGFIIIIIPSPYVGQILGFQPDDDVQSLLSCDVTLVPRQIHPLEVLSFSSQNICLKGQKKGFTFKCVPLSNAQCFQQCLGVWALHIKGKLTYCFVVCIFVFICLISAWFRLILVVLLRGCPVVGIPVLVCVLLTTCHKFTEDVWVSGWQARVWMLKGDL